MPRLRIWVVDHRGVQTDSTNSFHVARDKLDVEQADYQQTESDIIKVWNPRAMGWLDEQYYADYVAFRGAWDVHRFDPPELIGFFGYRKYLWMKEWYPYISPAPHCDHAPGWVHVPMDPAFSAYRGFLSTWDWAPVKELLAQYDILQAAPYTLASGSLVTDYVAHCGSPAAGAALVKTLERHKFLDVEYNKNYPNFLMITRWSVYDRMIREIEPMRLEMHGLGLDSTNEGYLERPGIYHMERIYPLWLKQSGLRIMEVPMLHCRDIGPRAPGW